MALDIVIEDDRWRTLNIEHLVEAPYETTLSWANLDVDVVETVLLVCDDIRSHDLNLKFREHNEPTNVLSWPTADLSPSGAGCPPLRPISGVDGKISLGDVMISYETCVQQATEADKSLFDHVIHLWVHGLLHLLGYDHIHHQDAVLMECSERQILSELGIGDPYVPTVAKDKHSRTISRYGKG